MYKFSPTDSDRTAPKRMTSSSASSARLMMKSKGREKPQLSCNFCRKRKLRCDRKQPCDSCKRLGQASSCSYPFPQPAHTHRATVTSSTNQDTLQARINQLESLVRLLVEKKNHETTSSTPTSSLSSEATFADKDEEHLSHDFGCLDVRSHETSYVESDHWSAILNEIGGLRDFLWETTDDSVAKDVEETSTMAGADLFLLQTPTVTKMDIVAAIPPRLVVDSIVAKYFNTADMPVALSIHRNVFFKQYEKFWEDPLSTPVMWMTILFGMMFMVAYLSLFVNHAPNSLDEETSNEYRKIVMISREKMIQSLRLGNYMKGTPHTVEALLFFIQIEYAQGEDTQLGCWQLLGVIIRIAIKMGYHRDGSHFPEMSIFDAEMRRRIWSILGQFDTASSSHVGLPRIVKQAQCDTAEPRNLLDEDFDDTSTVLPPARPQTQHTLAQFVVYKSRVTAVYGMICDFTTSSRQRNYKEVMQLDKLLNSAYAQRPPILEMKPMQRSIMDGVDLITRRFYLTTAFHMAQMTLHRKFMLPAKTDNKFIPSHTACIEAAFAVLRLQADVHEHCQPGRMLYSDRWKIIFLMQSEFLLATMILCSNLNDDIAHDRHGKSPLASEDMLSRTSSALQTSLKLWQQQREVSKETQKAVKAITVILNKAKKVKGAEHSNISSKAQQAESSFWSGPSVTSPASGFIGQQDAANDLVNPILQTNPSVINFLSSSAIAPPIPTQDLFTGDQFGAQMEFDSAVWGELFDMDESWDTWLQ